MPSFRSRINSIGNSKPIPIKAEVKSTVDKRLLISSTLPIPSATDLSRNIFICHFMIKNPNASPNRKRNSEKGKNLINVLNSFLLNAGFRKVKIWITKSGKETIIPTAIPQLIARFINWKGDVKTILIPLRLKIPIKNLIIFSYSMKPAIVAAPNTQRVKIKRLLASAKNVE